MSSFSGGLEFNILCGNQEEHLRLGRKEALKVGYKLGLESSPDRRRLIHQQRPFVTSDAFVFWFNTTSIVKHLSFEVQCLSILFVMSAG